jgi:hypothetical protein
LPWNDLEKQATSRDRIRIVDAQLYTNLRNGLWAVAARHCDKETADKEKLRLKAIVPDAFVRSGW